MTFTKSKTFKTKAGAERWFAKWTGQMEPAPTPGYPGPLPDGMDWSNWLAMNNVD